MKKILISLLLIAALAGVAVILVAVFSDNDKSAEEKFCDSLPALHEAFENVKSITIETDAEQAEKYKNDLKSAWDDTATAAKELASEKWDDVAAAYDELRSSLNSISDANSIEEALPDIKAAITEFGTTLGEMESVNCNTTNS